MIIRRHKQFSKVFGMPGSGKHHAYGEVGKFCEQYRARAANLFDFETKLDDNKIDQNVLRTINNRGFTAMSCRPLQVMLNTSLRRLPLQCGNIESVQR